MKNQDRIDQRNRKVVLIASLAGIPRVWNMARTLTDNGFEVTVFEWDRSGMLSLSEDLMGVRANRVSMEAPEGLKMIIKMPRWLMRVFAFVISNHFEIVQPQNLDNLLAVWFVSRLRKTRIVYDLADFWESGYVPSNMAPLGKIIGRLERTLTKNVDGLILVSEGQITQVGRGYLPSPSTILYNTVSDYELKTTVAPSHGDEIRLLFVGTLLRDRVRLLLNLATVLQAVDGFKLVIGGFGEMEEYASRTFGGMKNVTYLGFLPRDKAIEHTLCCDCVVLPYDPSLYNYRIALASKFFEALAMSKPLLVQDGIAMAELVREYRCGYVTDFLDTEKLQETVMKIRQDGHRPLRAMGVQARQLYDARYSWPSMEERLVLLYERVRYGARGN